MKQASAFLNTKTKKAVAILALIAILSFGIAVGINTTTNWLPEFIERIAESTN
jgi:TRAP-type C4-dicarboxylate transport system permease small subunit